MTPFQNWRRRSVLLAGLGLAGASLSNIARQAQPPEGNRELSDPAQQLGGSNNTERPLRLGWSPWADAELISLMVAAVIEQELKRPVERVMADIGIQYQSVARGDLDLMLMAWLPLTHREYWTDVRDRVQDYGPMYSGRLGWIVPNYVPESIINSIEQLRQPSLAARFNNRVQGIDPGSGLNKTSRDALKRYDLTTMELVSSSSAAMTAVLAKAIAEEDWLIATSWTPHWMFARYQLRFLKDPKGVFGGLERIHSIGRPGLDQSAPSVAAFLNRFHVPEPDLDALLLEAQDTSPAAAVERYLAENPSRLRYWTTGSI
ncbi:glycine betaine ABC transporter substrate-binding protein [Parasynechococcus sp.]|uniref:glycine betaine ABC transporter substrate-binding protein n=1 Tax=Parasynechococcus sp. TaxID=3101203 RepID=UPI0037042B7C